MAALLAVDRLVDGRKRKDDGGVIRAMAALLEVDRQIDAVRGGGGGGGAPPPPAKEEVDADQVETKADTSTKAPRSIFTNREKASALSYEKRALAAVRPLLETDRKVDRRKARRSLGATLDDVADLLKVDVEVDAAKREREGREAEALRVAREKAEREEEARNVPAQAATATAAAAAKRSIFSVREKRAGERSGTGGITNVVVGTTTVVRGGGEMIGSIPLGFTVPTAEARARDEFFGGAEARPPRSNTGTGQGGGSQKLKRGGSLRRKASKEGCVIM